MLPHRKQCYHGEPLPPNLLPSTSSSPPNSPYTSPQHIRHIHKHQHSQQTPKKTTAQPQTPPHHYKHNYKHITTPPPSIYQGNHNQTKQLNYELHKLTVYKKKQMHVYIHSRMYVLQP